MDVIEKAIRNAFEKGNPEDRAFRIRIYRSAFGALERAIAGSADTSPEAAEARRRDLKFRIAVIESEFAPAVAPESPLPEAPLAEAPLSEPSLSEPPMPAAGNGVAPAGREARPAADAFEPRVERDDRLAAGVRPVRDDTAKAALREARSSGKRRRRAPVAAILSAVILLLIVAAASWWVVNGGFAPGPAQREAGISSPPAAAGDGVQPGGATAPESWITVFSADDPTSVAIPADGKAEVMEDEDGKFLRVHSGAVGSEVRFDVGVGILERIAGRHVVFDILARSVEGDETEISVACDFGALGQCGRKRYRVGHERGDYLFEMDVPKARPTAAGAIAVNSDIEGNGRSVDILGIRVSVAK